MATHKYAQKIAGKPALRVSDLLELEHLGPSELVEGELIKMSPTGRRHGRIEVKLSRLIAEFVEIKQLGEVISGEVGIYLKRNPDTVRAADVAYISHARINQLSSDGYLDIAPELIVEILSPDDRWKNIEQKIKEYFEFGVNVVLIVNPDKQEVLFYQSPEKCIAYSEREMLNLHIVLPGFEVKVAEIFK